MSFEEIMKELKAGALITCDRVVKGDHYEHKYSIWMNCEKGKSPEMRRLHKDHMIGLLKRGVLEEDPFIKSRIAGREHFRYKDPFIKNT